MLRKAVEASGDAIFLTDQQGIITYINPEFTNLYGYDVKDIIGKNTPRILKSGLVTQHEYEVFWETLLNKNTVMREFVNKCKDGKLVTVESTTNPIFDDQGNIVGFLAIQRDITEQKLAKEALEAARAFQQSIINGIANPIMVISTNYQVELMNRAAQAFSVNESSKTKPSFCYQISHKRETPCNGLEHPCPLAQVREFSKTVVVEHKHHQADGEQRIVEIVASPLWGADSTFQGIIEVIRDITDRKLTEEKLQKYAERHRALAMRLAEVAENERRRLAQELHDQVGQNLTALGINLNIIRAQLPDIVDESVHFHLDDSALLVEQTTERIRDVMANLRPPVLDDYGLVAALRWYAEQFTRRTDITVSVYPEDPIPRMADRVENALFCIAQEAMTNVAKHSQASLVTVNMDIEDKTLRLVIADNGIGFDLAHLAEGDEQRGWGILSMTERAEAVDGHFHIETAPGQGTRVIVEINL
ncbi:MAG: PAS domain S-box protein [Chloroflexota bacterium]